MKTLWSKIFEKYFEFKEIPQIQKEEIQKEDVKPSQEEMRVLRKYLSSIDNERDTDTSHLR